MFSVTLVAAGRGSVLVLLLSFTIITCVVVERTVAFGLRGTTGFVGVIWIGEAIFVNQFKKSKPDSLRLSK